jgi:hypothetical protein
MDQAAEPLGLDAEVAGRADQVLEGFLRQCRQGVRLQEASLAEVADRPLYVPPTGILDQHGADHHLEGELGRPPVLRPEGRKEPPVDFLQTDAHSIIVVRPAEERDWGA